MLADNEATLRAKVAGNAAIGDPWAQVSQAVGAYRNLYVAYRFTQPMGDLYGYAETLVKAAIERAKPNGERLPGYTDSALPLLEKQVLDAKPVYPGWSNWNWNGACPRRANTSAPMIPIRA
jgi:hypothetical protein